MDGVIPLLDNGILEITESMPDNDMLNDSAGE